jgi:hypothetical protein
MSPSNESSEFQLVGRENDDQVDNQGGGAALDVATSRAASEVQSAMIIAKKFPRDENKAYSRIMQSCKRKSLADAAIYSFPRGGTTVEGPSIRLAEEMARQWGNVDFGIIELEQRPGESTCMSYAWDLETNTRQTKVFTVSHVRVSGSGNNKKKTLLDDPRDIYEMVANQGARRLRACILGIIPGDICEAAVDECNKTMAGPDSTPLIDRARAMVGAFSDFGVTIAMIEKRLSHKIDAISEAELQTLRKVYKSIKDGMATREAHFDLGEKQERPPAPPKAATGAAAAQQPETPPATTPPPAEQPAKTRQRAPKPAAEQQPSTPPPAAPDAPPEPPEEPAPKPEEKKKPEPRTSLNDGEILVCTVAPEEITALLIGTKPSVQIELGGGYRGRVYHFGGAKADAQNPEQLLVDPIWAMDRPVRVELVGKKQNSGGVMTFVKNVSADNIPKE